MSNRIQSATVRLSLPEKEGDAAVLQLDGPADNPATLDAATLQAMDDALAEIENRRPSAFIVRSGSPKYFCVGANLTVLHDLDAETIGPWIEHGHAVLNRLEALPCPVIARVEGYALGGGLELALACDWIAAADSACFGQTEAAVGLVPGWGGSSRLPERIGPAHAKRVFFTGAHIGAVEAERLGLIDLRAPDGVALDQALAEQVRQIAAQSPVALAAYKRLLADQRAGAALDPATAETRQSQTCLREGDARQRIEAFFNR